MSHVGRVRNRLLDSPRQRPTPPRPYKTYPGLQADRPRLHHVIRHQTLEMRTLYRTSTDTPGGSVASCAGGVVVLQRHAGGGVDGNVGGVWYAAFDFRTAGSQTASHPEPSFTP